MSKLPNQDTLAFQTNHLKPASLTIALLRASKIPSRYVHGTIEVPAEQFKNWMGGFSNLYAAYNYAGQGGIPAAAVVEGGKVTKIQMEHVWVEAAIDYYPSRGAKNRDADSWATDFNATILENALAESQTKLENYIDNNMTDPLLSCSSL